MTFKILIQLGSSLSWEYLFTMKKGNIYVFEIELMLRILNCTFSLKILLMIVVGLREQEELYKETNVI